MDTQREKMNPVFIFNEIVWDFHVFLFYLKTIRHFLSTYYIHIPLIFSLKLSNLKSAFSIAIL
jgi:hypothetical protein